MNQKRNGESLEVIVGKSFLRVVKNHSKYFIVMQLFKKIPMSLSRRMDGGERGQCIDIPSNGRYIDFLSRIAKAPKQDRDRGMVDNKYENITNIINHLLHNLLERGGVHPHELGVYGQEIFDLSCYRIYGDAFLEDMEQMRHNHPEMMNRNQLQEEYHSRYERGERITFEQFMKKYHSDMIGGGDRFIDGNEDENYEGDDDEDYPF